MKRVFVLVSLAALAACGADGEPIQPSMNANVGLGSNGMSGGVGADFVSGRFTMGVGTSL
ncbi:MAG: argininosuccinate lyase [Roseovarius sp.]|uniref:argininosuccinate lyase n=1 Tax=Roseovarius sp. TaxID=1486281 RepID=UPI0032F0632C